MSNSRIACLASAFVLAACQASSGTSSAPAPSASSAPAAPSASTSSSDSHHPITDLDVTGDVVDAKEHVRLVGSQEGRLEKKHMFTFTFSQVNEAAGTSRQVLSLQGGPDTHIGVAGQVRGNMALEGSIFSGICTEVVDSDSPDGPNRVRWLEGTFSCPEMAGPNGKKVSVLNGHFAGRFDDHRSDN